MANPVSESLDMKAETLKAWRAILSGERTFAGERVAIHGGVTYLAGYPVEVLSLVHLLERRAPGLRLTQIALTKSGGLEMVCHGTRAGQPVEAALVSGITPHPKHELEVAMQEWMTAIGPGGCAEFPLGGGNLERSKAAWAQLRTEGFSVNADSVLYVQGKSVLALQVAQWCEGLPEFVLKDVAVSLYVAPDGASFLQASMHGDLTLYDTPHQLEITVKGHLVGGSSQLAVLMEYVEDVEGDDLFGWDAFNEVVVEPLYEEAKAMQVSV